MFDKKNFGLHELITLVRGLFFVNTTTGGRIIDIVCSLYALALAVFMLDGINTAIGLESFGSKYLVDPLSSP